ncbi:ATP synthase subunit I [Desulfovibrio sp. JY]|nr:ATP synthase subunit I [Desulfovibrio sp. JY]
MLKNLRDRLDRWLLRRGYVHPEVRELVRNQIVLTALVLLVCLPLSGVSVAAWSLAAGTVIISLNFCSLARFGQRITGYGNKREAVLAVLARFYLRLAISGAALFACIVWFGAMPLPLLAGITTVVVNFLVWGAWRYAGSRTRQTLTGKEA